jgi:hypothetical protein
LASSKSLLLSWGGYLLAALLCENISQAAYGWTSTNFFRFWSGFESRWAPSMYSWVSYLLWKLFTELFRSSEWKTYTSNRVKTVWSPTWGNMYRYCGGIECVPSKCTIARTVGRSA